MAKYITKNLHKKFSKLIPELAKKTTPEDLWNMVCEKCAIEGEITVDTVKTKKAALVFTVKNKEYCAERSAGEIYVVNEKGDLKDERYDLLILDALEIIAGLKLWRKKERKKRTDKTTNKKEKND